MKNLTNRLEQLGIMNKDRICYSWDYNANRSRYKKRNLFLKGALIAGTLLGIITGLGAYSIYEDNIMKKIKEETESKKIELKKELKREKFIVKMDGKNEEFYYNPNEKVEKGEIRHGLAIWEEMNRYPKGHLYLFKDISSRIAVAKFAISGGELNEKINSIYEGVYAIKRSEEWPPYIDQETQKIKYKGGDIKNPWGYMKGYQYPILDRGSKIELLTKENVSISITPDENRRYLHGTAPIYEAEKNKDKSYEMENQSDFTPNPTIGCTRTSNKGMKYLAKKRSKDFRLAYAVQDNKEQD